MKSSTVIGGASEKHSRHEKDHYPTPPECTVALCDFFAQRYAITHPVWEPACGEGQMVSVLSKYYPSVFATDIRPDAGYGEQADFLSFSEPLAKNVVTNPPFDLAVEFIEKCISLKLDTFSLLLKAHFFHAANRYHLFLNNPPLFILPLTWRPVFVPTRGKQPTMEFSWFVWFKGFENESMYIPLRKPKIINQNQLF